MSAQRKKIRVGTIGYGGAYNMGLAHLRQLTALPGFVAEAVCDLDPSRLAEAEKDWPGIATYTDLDKMLAESDVELLVVILPHNVHAEITLKCLKAGRHVVVEKPFAITVAECDAMIREAQKRKVMLSTFHNRHWDALPVTLVKHVAKVGVPYRWRSCFNDRQEPRDWWRSDKTISGGVIYDWGAHFVEWMLQVMAFDMTEIAGYGANGYWDVTNEDELEAVVRFGANGVASHTTSMLDPLSGRQVTLFGTEGVLSVPLTFGRGGFVTYTSVNRNGVRRHEEIPLEKAANHKYYENIRDHLLRDKDLIISPEYARRVIQVLDYGSQSFDSGKALKAKYP